MADAGLHPGLRATCPICRRYDFLKLVAGFKQTKDFVESKAYVTTRNDKLYLISTFTTDGRTHPEYISTDNTLSMKQMLEKALSSYEPFSIGSNLPQYLLSTGNIQFIVEQDVFNNPKFKNLDLSGCKNVSVIGTDDKIRDSIRVNIKGKSTRFIKWTRYIFYSLEDTQAFDALTEIWERPFEREKVRLLNLFDYSETINKIKELGLENSNNFIPFDLNKFKEHGKEWCLKEIEKQIKIIPNSLLLILGQVSGKTPEIVIKDAKGNEYRVSFEELQTVCDKYNVSLFVYGCSSMRYAKSGTTRKISSIEAVKRYHGSLNCSTYGQFFESLSSPTIGLLLDAEITENVRVRCMISQHQSIKDMMEWIKNENGQGNGGSGGNGGSRGGNGGKSGKSDDKNDYKYEDSRLEGMFWIYYIKPNTTLISNDDDKKEEDKQKEDKQKEDKRREPADIQQPLPNKDSNKSFLVFTVLALTGTCGISIVFVRHLRIIVSCRKEMCNQRLRLTVLHYLTGKKQCPKCKQRIYPSFIERRKNE